jgi:hypothetical protein
MWANVLFASLFLLLFVWLLLVAWMFRRLRGQHAETFAALGSPSLFLNNTPRTNWLFLKFLFQEQWQGLGDRSAGYADCIGDLRAGIRADVLRGLLAAATQHRGGGADQRGTAGVYQAVS